MAVGPWDTSINIPNIPYYKKMKYQYSISIREKQLGNSSRKNTRTGT
jgi:hypothetical protein